MKSRLSFIKTSALLVALILFAAPAALFAQTKDSSARAKALKLLQDGNYKDAYEAYRGIIFKESSTDPELANDLSYAVSALQSAQRMEEVDRFLEEAIAKHPENWNVLRTAAQKYNDFMHQGYIVSGEFSRGWARGGDVRTVYSNDRDRVRALQLMSKAASLAEKSAKKVETAQLYLDYARMLLGTASWKLQALTDLDKLPDYSEDYYYSYRSGTMPAPVNDKGDPVYHYVPETLESAKSDGERWRWMRARAAELNPDLRGSLDFEFANFLDSQFGARTLATYGNFFNAGESDGDTREKEGAFSLQTLKDSETIARLANGIKRFPLPPEFNFVSIFKELAEQKGGGHQQMAIDRLAQLYEDRRQYPTAAKYWQEGIERFGPGSDNYRKKRLDQIVGAWGRFEGTTSQAAGENTSFEFLFRNATSVSFEAHQLNAEALVSDVIEYLRSNPKELNWQKIEINNIGYRIVHENEAKYVEKKVADWVTKLSPREAHFNRRITVEVPVKTAGAYLITAKVAGGNTTKSVIWLNDTAIVRKNLSTGVLHFFADAKSGAAVPGMKLQFFGYKTEYVERTLFSARSHNVRTSDFTAEADKNGQFLSESGKIGNDFHWLVIARNEKGRFAYLGFHNIWYGNYYDAEYNQTKLYGITDRPVYRPLQKVQYKVWARHAKYDREDSAPYANSNATIRITNPRGEKIDEKQFQFDEWAGYAGSLDLPKDAPLGMYHAYIDNIGSGFSFRVEEYKKPEFEVKIEAPSEPVALGEKITAKLSAKYYFGAPVTKGTVKYKIQRSDFDSRWYPLGLWDWFYGPGYWWFAYDYFWYPGWRVWGCRAPLQWWIWTGERNPPELVQEQEVEIGPEGKLEIQIDTALVKELRSDTDHKYQITAEVVDESRRVITGTGTILVARQPFKVYSWVDRGYYRSGDTIGAGFSAQTIDNKPVEGKGVVKLYSISYDESRKPVEKAVETWNLDTSATGSAALQMRAGSQGQYRISYSVTDKANHTIEGGYLFTVIGEGVKDKQFRFNQIELVPDKREYAPGEKIKLQINTEQANSTVLFFVRPANGVYLPPEVIRIDGKSVIREVEVQKKDMPNFFLEALTVSDGRVYSESKEIVVPPEKRVLNVEVLPSQEKYKPGEMASVSLKVTDFNGKPFSGSAVMSAYDKAVEYISGGSNVPEIKQFFWKWRRTHRSVSETNLMKTFAVILPKGEVAMGFIGMFGSLDANEQEELDGGGVPRGRSERQVLGKAQGFDGNAEKRMSKKDAAGAPAPASMAAKAKEESFAQNVLSDSDDKSARDDEASVEEPGQQATATVRKEFADTAYWNGNINVGADGIAKVSFKMPENLTGWKIRVWALGQGSRVGEGTAEVVTSKNLLLRLQAPRFFVEKDEVVLSANVHNYLASTKKVQAKLELPGDTLSLLSPAEQAIEVPSNGEIRVDWRVKVVREGQAVVRMSALSNEESDAMEMKFPVLVHGMLKTDSFSGYIRPEASEGSITFRVPEERRPDQSVLEVRYSPTLAGAMIDALPYLVDFPYGCTEQTMNRFIPTVITQRVLQRIGVNLKDVKEKRTNLNAQEIGDDQARSAQWKRYSSNPVFDEEEVAQMVRNGVQRLASMQLSGGGWGWFSGYGESASPHLSAGVVHGLQIARAADAAIPTGVIANGISYLKNYEAGELRRLKNAKTQTQPYKTQASELDVFVHMVLLDEDQGDSEMREFLYRDRNAMAVYAKAMQALIFHKLKDEQKVSMLRKNIEQFLVQDEENQTAYLKLGNEGYWWLWYGSEYEAHAYYLKLLAKVDPKSEIAPRLVKYLLNNRKHSTYWNSTRDTAIVVEAFADYLAASDEMAPDMTLQVLVDGKQMKEVKITKNNLFTFPNKMVLAGEELTSGSHTLQLKKSGKGPIYFNAYLTNFTLEDPIKRAGLEVKVNRKYFKLIRDESASALARGARGQAIDQKVEKYNRQELSDGETLKSGDLVQIELEIESKNDYEYLVFEDMKPAGFEPVEVRSGYNGNEMNAYVEFRDERVAFFTRTLPRGKRSVSYRMRAEIPGSFSALPTRASAMYAPELKGNSDELKLRVQD